MEIPTGKLEKITDDYIVYDVDGDLYALSRVDNERLTYYECKNDLPEIKIHSRVKLPTSNSGFYGETVFELKAFERDAFDNMNNVIKFSVINDYDGWDPIKTFDSKDGYIIEHFKLNNEFDKLYGTEYLILYPPCIKDEEIIFPDNFKLFFDFTFGLNRFIKRVYINNPNVYLSAFNSEYPVNRTNNIEYIDLDNGKIVNIKHNNINIKSVNDKFKLIKHAK